MPVLRSPEVKDRQRWTAEQDALLISSVAKVSPHTSDISWHRVASCLPGRTNKDCRKRWYYKIAQDFRKGPWSPEEDRKLRDAVQKHGTKWNKVSGEVGSRNGDQCWKRWNDSLDPSINHSPWDSNEDATLLEAVEAMGRNWSDIVSQHLPGRTALAAKNRFSLLHRRSTNARARTTESGSVEESPSPSSSPTTQSPRFEDSDLNYMDVNHYHTSIDFDNQPNGDAFLDLPDFGGDATLRLTDPQPEQILSRDPTGPITNSLLTPTSCARFEYANLSNHTFANDLDYLGSLTDPCGAGSGSGGRDLIDRPTKEVVFRAEYQSDRAGAVMEGLTKLVNSMLLQGDVKNVSFSIT